MILLAPDDKHRLRGLLYTGEICKGYPSLAGAIRTALKMADGVEGTADLTLAGMAVVDWSSDDLWKSSSALMSYCAIETRPNLRRFFGWLWQSLGFELCNRYRSMEATIAAIEAAKPTPPATRPPGPMN